MRHDAATAWWLMIGAFLINGVLTARASWRGIGPDAYRWAIPSAMLTVGAALTVGGFIAHAPPWNFPSRVESLSAPLLVVIIVIFGRSWVLRMFRHGRGDQLRGYIDPILVALSVLALLWHFEIRPLSLSTSSMMVVLLYMSCEAALLVPISHYAIVVREVPWMWLSAGVLVCAIGHTIVMINLTSGGEGTLGWSIISVGSFIIATGHAHPDTLDTPKRYQPRSATPDRMLSFGVVFVAWAVIIGSDRFSPDKVILVGIAIVTLFVIALRLFMQRRWEIGMLDELQQLAYTDPLTGAGNRRSLGKVLPHTRGWLLTLDLDGFKQVNDRHGHEVGDEVLRNFSHRIRHVLPKEALLYRLGGDEFAVWADVNGVQARHLGDKLLEAGRDPNFPQLSVSVGASAIHNEHYEEVLRYADMALQEAKRAGKDRMVVLNNDILKRRRREIELHTALASGAIREIHPFYQPFVALTSDTRPPVIGVEALARWRHQTFGWVPPSEFVELCEGNGLMRDLGTHMLQSVLTQMRHWQTQGVMIQASVNVSWMQLRDRGAVNEMIDLISAHADLAPWLILEVTETVFAEDAEAVEALYELRNLGTLVALDDFGVGSSTLTRLRTLPVDILKVDRSLTEGAGVDPSADAVLQAVIELGEKLHMSVVIEGVDDDTTAGNVHTLGYRIAQGFYWYKPSPPDELPIFGVSSGPFMPRRGAGRSEPTTDGLPRPTPSPSRNIAT